jgi:hypothetical protein
MSCTQKGSLFFCRTVPRKEKGRKKHLCGVEDTSRLQVFAFLGKVSALKLVTPVVDIRISPSIRHEKVWMDERL